ncbi:diacylglycerol/lipid kinase family protein [Sunxiuqinia elliptica]
MGRVNLENWMLLLNPHAGGGRGKKDLEQIMDLLQKAGFEFELFISTYAQHAIQLTKNGIEKGYRRIIVAGGDGTLNEVANGVLRQTVCDPSEILIGMIPVGTGNDWIRTFDIPNDYKKAIKRIRKGRVFWQDVGQIRARQNGHQELRFFTNMAGFGFDALVAEKANRLKERGRADWFVYLQSLVSSYLSYKTRQVSVVVDGKELRDLIFSVSVGIGKYNGGGLLQAPNAVPDNGLFQVTIIHKIGLVGILKNLPGLFNGRFIKDRRVSVLQGKEVLVESAFELAGEADGENLGNHRFELTVLPKKLQVIVGKKAFPKSQEQVKAEELEGVLLD